MNQINPLKRIFRFIFAVWVCVLSFVLPSQAQNDKEAPPALQSNRADEDYSYLKDPETSPYRRVFGDALKYIGLNTDRTIYLSLGASYRARFESFTNQDWTPNDVSYYSQRLTLNAGLNLGKHIRFFGELYHGYTSDTTRLFQSDDIDWHQGFVEFKFQAKEKHKVNVLFGRQELVFGATRLVGKRNGTNIRRTFDMARAIYTINKSPIQIFYGKEVNPQFEAFDNEFNLFEQNVSNPEIWGIYIQGKVPIKKAILYNEIYYIGFRSPAAGFSDVFGKEIRHSIGIRRFGSVGKRVTFNTEIIYQFGKLASSTISAYNIETDWKYIFINTKWRPTLGLKLDFSSGDRDTGDDKIQTFNPLFVNPAIYSLAAVNTPANLTSLHPSITIFPAKELSIYLDYALFFRTSRNDGLYAPPRFQTRPADGNSERHIGDALGLSIQYSVNRNISASFLATYFIPGEFVKTSGTSERTLYISTTLSIQL